MNIKTQNISFLVFFIICGFLLLFLVKGFFSILFFAFVLAVIINPIYKLFDKIPRINKYFASFLTLLTLFILSLAPIYYFTLSFYIEIINFKNLANTYSTDQVLYTLIDNVNSSLKNSSLGDTYLLNFYEVKSYLNQLYSSLYNRLFGFALSFSQLSISYFIKFIFFLFFTFYFVPNLKQVEKIVEKYSLLNPEHTKIFINKFIDYVKAFVQGIIPVAIIQGTSAGIILLILGVPNSFLLTLTMIFLSLIPFLGSGLTMFIIALVYFFTGDMTKSIIILVWNILVVTNIDNVFRTIFISKKTKLHPIVMFFAIVFGLQSFGFAGIFYGPLIVILFTTCFKLYKEQYISS